MLRNDLSDKLKVQAPKKAVTYKLVNSGQPHPITGKPMYKSAFDWVGKEVIYDEGDKERPNKELLYIKNTRKTANGIEPIVGRIEFGGPETLNTLTVPVRDFALYEYMERSNYNGSNPFRDPMAPIFFVRVDEEGEAKADNERADAELEALLLLRNMPAEALLTYAKSFSTIDPTADPEIIRQKLRDIAKADPVNFVKNSGSKVVQAKADIRDAQALNLITYEYSTRVFKWTKADAVFATVPEGIEQVDWLADYLLNDTNGETIYTELKRMLSGDTGTKKAGKK